MAAEAGGILAPGLDAREIGSGFSSLKPDLPVRMFPMYRDRGDAYRSGKQIPVAPGTALDKRRKQKEYAIVNPKG